MKKLVYLFAATAIFATGACNKDDGNNPPTPPPANPTAHVMFGNECINSNDLKVRLDGTIIQAIAGISYGQSTGYNDIAPVNSANTAFLFASTNTLLDDTTLTFADGGYYSVFAAGSVTTPTIIATTDDLSAPAAGNAKVRFINMSPDTLSETVYVGNTQLGTGITFGEVTSFVQIPAGTVNVIAQDPSNVPAQQTINGQAFADGKIYTIILTGLQSASAPAALKLAVIANN